MQPKSRTQIAGEADNQPRPRGVRYQLSNGCSLGPEHAIYSASIHEGFQPAPVLNVLHAEMPLSTSAFKSERGLFDLEPIFHSGLGIDTSKSSCPKSNHSQDFTIPIIPGHMSNRDNIDLVQHCKAREIKNRQRPVAEPEAFNKMNDLQDTAAFRCKPIKRENDTDIVTEPVVQSRKRSGTKAFSIDQVESDGLPAKQRVKIDSDNGEKARSQFACPFQKLNSHKHHECLKYALHRIKDVKQHVYRRHKQPDYYCARCFVIFKTADTRDEHARSNHCNNLVGPGFEGITEDQKIRLNKSSSRGLDPQEQWFEMWDIIFPGQPRPSSAWVGSYMEEMVPLLRSLWKYKGSSILAKIQKDQTKPLDRGLLDGVVELIFDCLDTEASASLGNQTRGNCSQGRQSLMGAQLPTSTPPFKVITEPPELFFAEPYEFFQEINGEPETEFNGFSF